MTGQSIDAAIEVLLRHPHCSIEPRQQVVELPEMLPDDVRRFFSRCRGGGLFFDRAHSTPQFGCELSCVGVRPISQQVPCEGDLFNTLYSVAEFTDMGDYDCAVVGTAGNMTGNVLRLNYSLGDPSPKEADLEFLAPSFTRWMNIHIEAWEVYQTDWREGLRHFAMLLSEERRKAAL